MAKILLTNDDGVGAPGLNALLQAAQPLGECIVVAPAREQSGCSHGITTGRPMGFRQVEDAVYVVDGTPADCVRVGLDRFDGEVGLVLSGINNGANLGVDVYHSGTVAAVREAVFHGVRGIALSHYRNRVLEEGDWHRAARWVAALLQNLAAWPWAPHTFLNANLPSLAPEELSMPAVVRCPLDPSPLPLSFQPGDGTLLYNGRYSERQFEAHSDVAVCLGGCISLTEVTAIEASR